MTQKGGFAGVPPPAAERPYCAHHGRSAVPGGVSEADILTTAVA